MTLTPTTRTVAGLGFTQIVGWGTAYLMPSVLGRSIQGALSISSELVFAGITVMFGIGALCSPRVGRIVDRAGARWVMTVGSLVYALALAGLSMSQGPLSYLACWAVLGVASSLALSIPSSIAMVQIAGPAARQAISMLTIIGGFASSVFWPVTGVLDAALGWRETLLIYAAIHLLACAPVHFLVLPRRPPVHPPSPGGTAAAASGIAPSEASRAYLLLSISLSFGAFVFTGVQVHVIEILRGLGHAPASALLLASLIGPAQVCIRLFEMIFGHRYSIMRSAVLGSAMLPLGICLALIAGDGFVVALVVMMAYGMSNGLKAVQRATLPLALFGRTQFGAYMGRLALPQGIVSAVSPPAMAAVLSQVGTSAALWVTLAAATVSLAAMIMLARLGRNVR